MNWTNLSVTTIAGLAFAAIFFVVGAYRTVEIHELNIGLARRRVLMTAHVLGCLLFSAALALASLNESGARRWRDLSFGLFVAALIVLAPGQWTIGQARRKSKLPSRN